MPHAENYFRKRLNLVGLTTHEIIGYLQRISEIYHDTGVEIELPDISDKIFLGAAIASRAEYLITGDKHLLSLKKFQKTKILQPREFLEIIERKKNFKS